MSSDVELVRWPGEATRRDELAAHGVPRLLLIEHGDAPPAVPLGLEDWILVPADERDLFARMARLERRHRALHPAVPMLEDGLLRNAEQWVALTPREATFIEPLLAAFGRLVTVDEVGAPQPLKSLLRHLRLRLSTVGLQITTVRRRGFILDFVDGEAPE